MLNLVLAASRLARCVTPIMLGNKLLLRTTLDVLRLSRACGVKRLPTSSASPAVFDPDSRCRLLNTVAHGESRVRLIVECPGNESDSPPGHQFANENNSAAPFL